MSTAVSSGGLQLRPKVRLRRLALFYGLAFGWVCLIAAGLYLVGSRDMSLGQAQPIVTVVLAVAYMPAPLVAALLVERLDRRSPALKKVFVGFWRLLPKLALVAVTVTATLMLAMLGLTWVLGNVLGVSGVGQVVYTPEDLLASVLTMTGSADATQVSALASSLPPFWAIVGLTFLGALAAGFTINGLFALGEEYGWRGWLADELRPLGAVWANLITGVLWGLWHGPLILMGFNYGGYAMIGTAFMIVFCIPMSFLLWRAREVTGSVLTAAVLHGALNGFAGLFTVIVVNTKPIIAVPMGLVGAAAIAVVTALFWLVTRKRAGRAG